MRIRRLLNGLAMDHLASLVLCRDYARTAEKKRSRKPVCSFVNKWIDQDYDSEAIEHQRFDANHGMWCSWIDIHRRSRGRFPSPRL